MAAQGRFPPLDTKTFPSQIFWLVIFFALLYALMSKLVLPKIACILEARRNRIEGDLARASALKDGNRSGAEFIPEGLGRCAQQRQ